MSYILGIEGSANKLGIGIIDLQGEILVNRRKTYCAPTGEGFMPRETAKHHQEHILNEIESAMREAHLQFSDLKAIAYTKGPGMGNCLIVGAVVARTLSVMHDIPLIGVNHCVGHIEMGRLICKCDDPVVLYVSGGNTQIISYSAVKRRYLIYGETIDVAVGNALDRYARLVGISNDPCPGYNIEQSAKQGQKYVPLPYTVKGMDVSFSGMTSYLERFCLPMLKRGEVTVADLSFSLQETVFAMLIEITERLLSYLKKSEVLIVGGVGCNKRLQEMMQQMLEERGGFVHAMDQRYCIDNGCMIAYAGLLELPSVLPSGAEFEANRKAIVGRLLEQSTVTQRFRTDEVFAGWRE